MKEVEENNGFIDAEINGAEEERLSAGEIDDSVFQSLKNLYNRATSLDMKYEYYVQLRLYIDAKGMTGQEIRDDMYDSFDNVEADFIRLLKAADPKQAAKVVQKLETSLREQAVMYGEEKKMLKGLIANDDPYMDKKLSYLASNSTSGALRLKNTAAITNVVMNDIRTDPNYRKKIYNTFKVYFDTTAKEFATICGFKGDRLNEYISKRLMSKPEDKLEDVFTRYEKITAYRLKVENGEIKVPEEDKKKAISDPYLYDKDEVDKITVTKSGISSSIVAEISHQWLSNQMEMGKQRYYKKHNLSQKDIEKIDENISEARSETSGGKIEAWTAKNGEGRRLLDNLRVITGRGFINDQKAKISREKGYDQYIRLHSGYKASHRKKAEVTDNLAKSIAASLLKKSGKKFDISLIHKTAKEVKKMSVFKSMTDDPMRLLSSMMDAKAVDKTRDALLEKTFMVSKDEIVQYVEKMQALFENMITKGSQSKEYREFRKAVSQIAKLGQEINLNTEQGRAIAAQNIISLNANLLSASEKYMKDRKSVRGTTEGEYRFNNTIDSLAIMSRYAKGSKDQVMISVDKINAARKVTEGQKNFIKLDDFGEKRAERARKEREPKKHMTMEKKMQKV